MDKSITKVVKKDLCHGCGICKTACPTDAIEFTIRKGLYIPIVNNKCINCEICLKTCPGISFDYIKQNNVLFNEQPDDVWIGHFKGLYLAYSNDFDIRFNSSSGGALTSLLIYALENKVIDGAILVKMNEQNPLMPELFIANDKKGILGAMGSKYCPVSIDAKIKDIINKRGNYAITGLPCHIHGLRKYQQVNKSIKDKLILSLGLFCSNTASFYGTEFFLRKKGINLKDVKEIKYRSGGWLGNISVLDKFGNKINFPRVANNNRDSILHKISFHTAFSPIRCLLCADHTSEFSDISFGDPRLPNLIKNDKIGHSLIITRTNLGEELFRSALKSGYLKLVEEINRRKFFQAQHHTFKVGFYTHYKFHKLIKKPLPDDKFNKKKITNSFQFFRIIEYLPSYYSHHRSIWPFLMVYARIINYIKKIVNVIKAINNKMKINLLG